VENFLHAVTFLIARRQMRTHWDGCSARPKPARS
jgi:hypothetical protein